jgi:mycothiol synthase
MNVTTRHYRDGDLDVIVEVINAADALDHLDEATDALALRELLHRPDFDPYNDALVVLDEDQRIVGHARLDLKNAPRQTRFYVHTVVHPDWRDEAIEELLLEQLWSTAQERRRMLGSKPAQFRTYCAAHLKKRISLFESFGLRPVRYDLHMVYHPLDDLPDPAFPPGIRGRPYSRGEDDESALEVVNAAFSDVMDFAAVKPEDFRHWMESPSFRDYLSYVALDGKDVVGLCLCTVSEARASLLGRRDGTVHTLCVRREYQRRGLGSALLLTSLQAFKRAGLESATLDTDTENPTEAIRLYEQAGFREAWRWVTFGKEMGSETTLAQHLL